jgi:hypothetical protein
VTSCALKRASAAKKQMLDFKMIATFLYSQPLCADCILDLPPARGIISPHAALALLLQKQNKANMKSIWIFLLGSAINLLFLSLIFLSYLQDKEDKFVAPDRVPYTPFVVLIAGSIIAGGLARHFNRPGLGNVLVMVFPSLGILAAMFFIFLFIIPKGLEIKHIFGIILAVAALAGAFYLKKNSYKRVFDASRAQVARQQESQASAGGRVSFSNTGRSGLVTYNSGTSSFDLYFEFGGNDVLAVINVPGPDEWLAQTGLAPGERARVLHEIGMEAVKTQTQNGRYVLEGNSIVVYSR